MMYKYCRRCGRRLVGEENRRRGYGKTCYAKRVVANPQGLFSYMHTHAGAQEETQPQQTGGLQSKNKS